MFWYSTLSPFYVPFGTALKHSLGFLNSVCHHKVESKVDIVVTWSHPLYTHDQPSAISLDKYCQRWWQSSTPKYIHVCDLTLPQGLYHIWHIYQMHHYEGIQFFYLSSASRWFRFLAHKGETRSTTALHDIAYFTFYCQICGSVSITGLVAIYRLRA